ncbi:MAG: exodeoxyribonuclease III [bacterium]
MRIFSWNVNGIRAAWRKGMSAWLAQGAPDVLGLQEIKATPAQLDADQLTGHGYHVVWNPAKKPGYSGTATFSRTAPDEVILGFGEDRFDDEGRVTTTRHGDVWVVNAYFPHGQRDFARMDYKTDFYRAMAVFGDRLRATGKPVIICGDWNTAHQEVDIKNAKANRKTSGFTDEDRALVDEFVAAGWVDTFRALHPDAVDVYSWWSQRPTVRERNIGWRIDYHFASAEAMARVKAARVHMDVLGSDHCPVEVELD